MKKAKKKSRNVPPAPLYIYLYLRVEIDARLVSLPQFSPSLAPLLSSIPFLSLPNPSQGGGKKKREKKKHKKKNFLLFAWWCSRSQCTLLFRYIEFRGGGRILVRCNGDSVGGWVRPVGSPHSPSHAAAAPPAGRRPTPGRRLRRRFRRAARRQVVFGVHELLQRHAIQQDHEPLRRVSPPDQEGARLLHQGPVKKKKKISFCLFKF